MIWIARLAYLVGIINLFFKEYSLAAAMFSCAVFTHLESKE